MLKNSLLVIFLSLLVLNLITYRNAGQNELRYDQPEVYQGSEIPRFEDRLKYVFSLKTPDPSIAPNLLWFRPGAFLISWQLFLMARKQPYVINLFNILFLTITGFALFRLINYLSGDQLLAFIASALFCVHPVTGIWVNYVPGGVHGLLVLAFMLSSLYYFIVFINEDRRTALVLSLSLFAVGLMFHEIACFLPFYMAASIYFLLKKDTLKTYAYLIPFGVIIVVYILLRTFMLGGKGAFGHPLKDLHVDLLTYGLTLTKVFYIFLAKLVTLKGIVVNWCEPVLRSFSWMWAISGALIVGACSWLMTAKVKGIVPWALGLIFVGFLPVCIGGRYALKEGLIYEGHWLFFTSIGFFILLAWILSVIFHRRRFWGTALIGGVICSWIVVGGFYNRLYADDLAYALYYREYAPGFRMGNIFVYEAYFKRDRYDEARTAIRAALTETINDYGIYQRLAYLDFLQGRYDDAENNIKSAQALSAKSPDDLIFLGDIYGKKSEYSKAVDAYQQAIKMAPDSLDAWLGLADAYNASGHVDEAKKIWERFSP